MATPLTKRALSRIKQARTQYDRLRGHWKSRMSPTFEEMYQYFCTDLSNEVLSEKSGVTTQTLSIYFREIFAGLPGCKSASEREERRHTAVRKETLVLAEAILFSSDPMCHIVKSAEVHGCHVSAIPSGDKPWGVYGRRILVNRKPCHVYYINKALIVPGGKKPYGCAEYSHSVIEDVWRVITYLQPPGYKPRLFVVPPRVVLDAYTRQGRQHVKVFIPVLPFTETYKNHQQRVPWDRYENKWPGVR